MKPKQSQPTGVCCYCVLSKSYCNSPSECPLVSPLIFLLFSFHGNNHFHDDLFSCVPFHFLHLFISHKSTFSLPCGLSASQGVPTSVWEKSSNISLVGFACVCVLIWSCCGILQPLMACFLTLSKFWVEKGKHKSQWILWRPGQKGKLCDFHDPQSISPDQMRPSTSTSEPSCQQHIEAFPFDRSLIKQARRTLSLNGIGGVLSLCIQLAVSAINQHSSGITWAVFRAAVWPDIWSHCDYSLG